MGVSVDVDRDPDIARLVVLERRWTGHTGHRDPGVGPQQATDSFRHGVRHLLADGRYIGTAEQRTLQFTIVGGHPAPEDVARPRHRGEARAHQPAGEGLGDPEAPLDRPLQNWQRMIPPGWLATVPGRVFLCAHVVVRNVDPPPSAETKPFGLYAPDSLEPRLSDYDLWNELRTVSNAVGWEKRAADGGYGSDTSAGAAQQEALEAIAALERERVELEASGSSVDELDAETWTGATERPGLRTVLVEVEVEVHVADRLAKLLHVFFERFRIEPLMVLQLLHLVLQLLHLALPLFGVEVLV